MYAFLIACSVFTINITFNQCLQCKFSLFIYASKYIPLRNSSMIFHLVYCFNDYLLHPGPTTIPLIVVLCLIAVIAIVLFVLFIVALCQCIKSRRRNKYFPDSPNSIVLTAPDENTELPPNSFKTRTLTTSYNDSYGHVPDNAGIPQNMSNGCITSDRTYEEIKSSKSSIMQSSPASDYNITKRPPIPVPYAVPDTKPLKEDLYTDATGSHGRGVTVDNNTSNVNNPAYGRSEREGSLTPENYLIVTESKQ